VLLSFKSFEDSTNVAKKKFVRQVSITFETIVGSLFRIAEVIEVAFKSAVRILGKGLQEASLYLSYGINRES